MASLLIQMHALGQPLAMGTGFVVVRDDQPWLVTNYHNLAGRDPETGAVRHNMGALPDAVRIFHNAAVLGDWKPVTEPTIDDDERPLWNWHRVHERTVDVVALPLTQLDGVQLYPYDPWDAGPGMVLNVASEVHVVGFPFGLTGGGLLGVWVRGTMATEPAIDWQDLPLMLIDARGREGNSGSPVILYTSGGAVAMAGGATAIMAGPAEQFVGVYSGRVNAQSDLGFVWKPVVVREIITDGVRPIDR